MIIVSDPSKPIELTAKGSARRNFCLSQYGQEIEELYRVVEESSQSGPPPPTEWSRESTLDYIRGLVQDVLQQPLQDTDDLFQHGCDRQV